MAAGSDLIGSIRQLRTAGSPERPARHQAILLLWGIGRAYQGQQRLLPWSTACESLRELLSKYGLPENRPTPEYPFIALAHTDLWELDSEQADDAPPAHGSNALRWLNDVDPAGGLRQEPYERLATDPAERSLVVDVLLERFFSGDDPVSLLQAVGLEATGRNPDRPAWDLPVGTELRRSAVHDRFGGSRQGEISSAPASDSVLLFTNGAGIQYGYHYDGWREDGSYHYTGEGPQSDQRMVRGNKVIAHSGRTIRLFEEVRRTVVRYVGAFRLDADQPWYREDGIGSDGEMRSVIVFKLWPADRGAPGPAEEAGVTVRSIPVESHKTEKFFSKPADAPTESERREAALVQRYASWLAECGHTTSSREIRLLGKSAALYSDLFDEWAGELIEAKGATSRNHVRLALGQVLDYARYVDHHKLAVLVPVRPVDDMVSLLVAHEVSCIFETSTGTFDRVDP